MAKGLPVRALAKGRLKTVKATGRPKVAKAKGPALLRGTASIHKALTDLVKGAKVSAKAADALIWNMPITERAGYALVRRRGGADPRKWKTIVGVPVHVDFSRKPWLPGDWYQGIKRTSGGNTYTVYMPPGEIRTFYHQWQVEEYLGRKVGPADGFQGQLRLAAAARAQDPWCSQVDFFRLLTRQERAELIGKSGFHFAIISARRAQCPDGAADIAVVQNAFLSAGVVPTWYVDEDSLDAYRALGLRAVVGGKLTPARNRALDDARRRGKVCVQCSDDISTWEYRDGEPAKDRTMDAQNEAHRRAKRYVVSPVMAAQFVLAKMRGADDGPGLQKPRLGGAYVLGDCSRTWGGEATSRRHFILGDFFVADGSKVRFDERLSLKEDYDFCAQHIHAHGSVMRCNRLTFTAKHYSNSGGAVDNRDAAGEKERANMAILFQKWPRAILPHGTRKNEVVLRWPADGQACSSDLPGPCAREDGARTPIKKKPASSSGGPSAARARSSIAKRRVARGSDLPQDAVLVQTGKRSDAPYIARRCRKAAGLTVAHALGALVVANKVGKSGRYKLSDLRYDLQRGFLSLAGPSVEK